jgi:1-acyl-sn-glycerol-3-phosphate acyltransferase
MPKVKSVFADDTKLALATYWLGRNACVLFCRIWFRLSVEGLENIPASGPFVLSPVHRSNMDTPIAAVCTKRRMRYMGKDSLWKHPASAWLFSSLGGFPVARGSADREAITRSIDRLAAGEPLVLFPEGERKEGTTIAPLKDGAVYLASKAQVAIVPVGIGGSARAMGKGAKFIRPSKVHVVIGKPIPPAPLTESGRISRDHIKVTTEVLRDDLQHLFDQARHKVGEQ